MKTNNPIKIKFLHIISPKKWPLTYKKMISINIINCQGIKNQNHDEVLLIPTKMVIFKRQIITSADNDMEKLQHSYIVGGNVKCGRNFTK